MQIRRFCYANNKICYEKSPTYKPNSLYNQWSIQYNYKNTLQSQ
jgi:hypothetical protein